MRPLLGKRRRAVCSTRDVSFSSILSSHFSGFSNLHTSRQGEKIEDEMADERSRRGLNPNAQAFVPNPAARPFIPGQPYVLAPTAPMYNHPPPQPFPLYQQYSHPPGVAAPLQPSVYYQPVSTVMDKQQPVVMQQQPQPPVQEQQPQPPADG